MNTIPEIPVDAEIPLPPQGAWPASVHVFDARSARAIRAALAAQRPLLVRGEPGTGKSQLARAAAVVLQRLFVAEVIQSRSESQDLQWRFDAVGRLGEAQALGAAKLTADEVRSRLDPINYLSPGPLWWVLDWHSADEQQRRANGSFAPPVPPKDWQPEHGSVLLLDEIDKADADLPNGLLETLGNGAFHPPWRESPVQVRGEAPPPLVIVTTNEERELPAAFVRRCLVLNLHLPDDPAGFVAFLVARGKVHFKARCHPDVFEAAARQLWDDRRQAELQGMTPPGQAEYLDLLRVVATLEPDLYRQKDFIAEVGEFTFNKHPVQPT
jgi:MoxR-like ATPase